MNRPVFGFNREVDDHALGPVSRGWKKITPKRDARRHLERLPQPHLPPALRQQPRPGGTRHRRHGTRALPGEHHRRTSAASSIPRARWDSRSTTNRSARCSPAGASRPARTWWCRWSVPRLRATRSAALLGVAMNPLMWLGVGVPGLGVLFAVNGRAQAERPDRGRQARRARLLRLRARRLHPERRPGQLVGRLAARRSRTISTKCRATRRRPRPTSR